MTTAERLRQEGRQEGGYTMILSLVQNAKKQGFSDEVIARIVNMDVASVRKILNNEIIEIPWHLLKP